MFDLVHLLNTQVMSPAWLAVVRARDPYIFMTEWELTPFLFFAVTAVFFAVFLWEQRPSFGPKRTRELYFLLAAPLILSVISFLTVDVLGVSSFIQLQLYRSLVVWKIILTLTFAYYAFTYAQRPSRDYLYSFFLLGLAAAIVVEELLVLLWLPGFTLLWLERRLQRPPAATRPAWDIPKWLHALLLLGTFFVASGVALSTRSFLIPLFITTTLIAIVAVIYVARSPRSLRLAASCGLVVALLYASNPPVNAFSLYPAVWQQPDFVAACDWIRQHTSPAAMFVSEPFAPLGEEVKFFCERNLFYSGKDGAQVLFSEAYALEWYRRRQLFDNILPDAAVVENALKENVDYIISNRPLADLSDHEVFGNTTYRIYQLK
jgi:hypothetical protein